MSFSTPFISWSKISRYLTCPYFYYVTKDVPNDSIKLPQEAIQNLIKAYAIEPSMLLGNTLGLKNIDYKIIDQHKQKILPHGHIVGKNYFARLYLSEIPIWISAVFDIIIQTATNHIELIDYCYGDDKDLIDFPKKFQDNNLWVNWLFLIFKNLFVYPDIHTIKRINLLTGNYCEIEYITDKRNDIIKSIKQILDQKSFGPMKNSNCSECIFSGDCTNQE